MPPMRTKITATMPVTAMMASRILVMTFGKALALPLQPAASLTEAGALELQTSSAKVGVLRRILLRPRTQIMAKKMFLINLVNFMDLL